MFENKSVFNCTFCQLLMEKPNCMKIFFVANHLFRAIRKILQDLADLAMFGAFFSGIVNS